MKITKKGEYGLLEPAYILARNNKVVLGKEVSENLGLPREFMVKIFQKMARKGILGSFKEKKGGFSLNLPLEEVIRLSVIEAIKGPHFIMWCTAEDVGRGWECALEGVFRRAQVLPDDYFDNFMLKELTSGEDS